VLVLSRDRSKSKQPLGSAVSRGLWLVPLCSLGPADSPQRIGGSEGGMLLSQPHASSLALVTGPKDQPAAPTVQVVTHSRTNQRIIMRTRSKLLFAALTSALVLAAVVGSASANRLSQNEQGFRVTYSPLTFTPSFGTAARCRVTLEGSFHSRTISKVAGALIGFVSRASVGPCESGNARVNLETLPWHIQYATFEGTLPAIASITQNLIRPSFTIQGEIFGLRVNCRYTTPSQGGINTRESRGAITSQNPDGTVTTSETGGCPTGTQSGIGTVTGLGNTTPIVVTLI
jgi:hypothetical protein